MLEKLPPMLASIGKGVFRIKNNMDYIQAENFLINNLRTLRIAKEPNKTRVAKVDDNGNPTMWYQTIRLFNQNYHVKREAFRKTVGLNIPVIEAPKDKKAERIDYSQLKYVSVGGEKIDEDIWAESLFGQVKA